MPIDTGARIALARRRSGLTQAGLAVRLGITRAYVARVETGHHRPRLPTLVAFARALDLSAKDLLSTREDCPMDPRYRARNSREEDIAMAYGSASYTNALRDVVAVLHGEELEPTRSSKRRELRTATLDADDDRVRRIARKVATATVRHCRALQREGQRIPRRLKVPVKTLELVVQASVKKGATRHRKRRSSRRKS